MDVGKEPKLKEMPMGYNAPSPEGMTIGIRFRKEIRR